MLIGDWMTKDVITVQPETSMMKASKIMRENKIHRLPVVDDKGLLVGVVTDRDLKEASPSKATTLDMHELYYLLSEIKIKDIMTRNPLAVNPGETVEKAALIMLNNHIGGLPVVDDKGKVAGVITGSDVLKVLVRLTGITQGGVQLAFKLQNVPGALKALMEDLKALNMRVISVLTSSGQEDEAHRQVYIRIFEPEKSVLAGMVDSLAAKYNMLYWVHEAAVPAK
jgi:acetoin utilization protein AcuB